MKINKNIIFRYESKLLGGKTFIFNLATQDILISDFMAYEILTILEGNEVRKEELINEINSIYKIDVSDKMDKFLTVLSERKMITT